MSKPKKKPKPQGSDIATNKKARHDFLITDTFEAGIELRGTEVKAFRAGRVNIRDAFARVDKGQVWLHGMDVQPYERASYINHESKRPRRLLLHKREILKLTVLTAEKGYTLVPLKAYWKHQLVKVEIGAGKGKTHVDRRHDLKERVENMEAKRAMANFNRK